REQRQQAPEQLHSTSPASSRAGARSTSGSICGAGVVAASGTGALGVVSTAGGAAGALRGAWASSDGCAAVFDGAACGIGAAPVAASPRPIVRVALKPRSSCKVAPSAGNSGIRVALLTVSRRATKDLVAASG